jgi:hypothetical protein
MKAVKNKYPGGGKMKRPMYQEGGEIKAQLATISRLEKELAAANRRHGRGAPETNAAQKALDAARAELKKMQAAAKKKGEVSVKGFVRPDEIPAQETQSQRAKRLKGMR